MMQRRRFATRDELARLVDERLGEHRESGTSAVFEVLAELGVDLSALVKITVAEPDSGA